MTLLSSALPRPNLNHTQAATQTASQQAPVFQFACLFTHDIRRKNTKRWQDGYLSLHSFNGRVMVYDESRNYIGDTFQKDVPLEDGDELNLDRAGVLVQVGEKKATEQTDLTDLLAKRHPKALEKEKQPQARTTAPPLRTQPSTYQSSLLQSQTQRRWTGWAARAQVPTESPHALKQATAAIAQKENVTPDGPPRKKQRQDDEHIPLWQILKTSKPARSQPAASPATSSSSKPRTPQMRPGRSATRQTSKPNGQANFTVKEVIDITGMSSDRAEPVGPQANEATSSPARRGPLQPSAKGPPNPPPGERQVHDFADRPEPGGVYNSPVKRPAPQPPSKPREPSKPDSVPKIIAPTRARSSIPTSDHGNKPAEQAVNEPEPRDLFEGPLDTPDPDPAPRTANQEANPVQTPKPTLKCPATTISRPAAGARPKASLGSRATNTRNVEHDIDLDTPPRSPPVSTTSRLHASDSVALQHPENDVPREKEDTSKSTKKQQTKPLRLSSAAPKRKLFCQTLTNTDNALHAQPTSLPASAASTSSTAAISTKVPEVVTKDSTITKRKKNATQIISIHDDENSQEAFEVMKPKKRRLEDARRNAETEKSAKVSAKKTISAKATSATRSSAKIPSARPSAEHRASTKQLSAGSASTIDEGGLPSITNQVDQRPEIPPDIIVHTNGSKEARNQPKRASTSVGIEYGTTSLDAEFLSPVPPSAAVAPVTARPNFTAVDAAVHADKAAELPPNRAPDSDATTNVIPPTSLKRSLKRVTSDVSPMKKGASSRIGLSRRAETVSVVQETRKQQDKAETCREQAQDKDLGAWSKEAWDLFGGCPAGREERPIWAYDVPDLVGAVDSSLSGI